MLTPASVPWGYAGGPPGVAYRDAQEKHSPPGGVQTERSKLHPPGRKKVPQKKKKKKEKKELIPLSSLSN